MCRTQHSKVEVNWIGNHLSVLIPTLLLTRCVILGKYEFYFPIYKGEWVSIVFNIPASSNSLVLRFYYVIIEAYQH